MADIYTGLAIVASLSICLFLLAVGISHAVPKFVSDVLATGLIIGMVLYIQYLWYDVRLVELLPFSNLVIIGNWFPFAAAILSGFAWERIPGSSLRKCVPVLMLFFVAGYATIFPLLGERPQCLNVWAQDGVCVQTTQQTCSAACAASLLRYHGIQATEQEMAELCLTRRGTTWMGLYRGLKLKTQGTSFDVEVLSCDAEELLAVDSPSILSVGVANTQELEASYAAEWGWKPGVGHSVLLLGPRPTGIRIVDPTMGYGREIWTRKDLNVLFRGTAMRLVERP